MSGFGGPQPGWWQASDGNWYPPHLQPGLPGPVPGPVPPKRRSGLVVGLIIGGIVAVIVVLGIVGAIVVFSVGSTTSTAQKAACRIEVQTLVVANEAARATSGRYYDGDTLAAEGYLTEPPRGTVVAPTLNAQSVSLSPVGRCAEAYQPFSYAAGDDTAAAIEKAFAE